MPRGLRGYDTRKLVGSVVIPKTLPTALLFYMQNLSTISPNLRVEYKENLRFVRDTNKARLRKKIAEKHYPAHEDKLLKLKQ